MANLLAIHSVGESLRAYLDASYPTELQSAHPCTFTLVSSGDVAKDAAASSAPPTTASAQCLLFLYNVAIAGDARSLATNLLPGQSATVRGVPSLVVDLHFLISVSASNAATEHVVLAYTMRQLALHSVFDASSLTSEAGWAASETVQLAPESLTITDLTNLWTALGLPYRVGAAYVARSIHIEADANTVQGPILTRTLATSLGGTPA